MKWDGGGAWVSLAYGFENVPVLKDNSQLMAAGLYRNKETVADPNNVGQFLIQEKALAGGRFRVGNPNFQLSWEGTYIHRRPKGFKVDNSFETALSAEARITAGLWLNVAFWDGKRAGQWKK